MAQDPVRSLPGAPGLDEDDHLVRRFLASGRVEDFEALVRRHQRKVFRIAVSVLGRGREVHAEDVTQEVFLQVYRKLTSFQGRSRFSTWLYRVTYRRAIDEVRSLAVRPETPVPESQELGTVTPARDPLRDRQLRRCLERLPEVHRTAIHLHYWLGYTVSEIVDLLGTRPGTVKSWLFRARELLGRCLESSGERT